MSQANREIENWNIEIFGEKWDDTCITAVITRWEEDSKKEKHVGGGGGYAFDDEGNILK